MCPVKVSKAGAETRKLVFFLCGPEITLVFEAGLASETLHVLLQILV